jgi:hypothetical protein
MSNPIECLRCHTTMESGFIADRTNGSWTQEKWSPGQAVLHWWGMEKPEGGVPVTTMRCPRCGVLESFARPA